MRVRELMAALPGAQLQGPDTADVTGVTADSRKVTTGNLFAAMPGATPKSRHGLEFVGTALAQGAVVVLADKATDDVTRATVRILVDNVPIALARVAEAFHGQQSSKMRLLGVTGTNGKTTSAHMIEAIAIAAGEMAAFIGTTAVRIGSVERAATHTTPPSEDLSALMAEMVKAGVRTCGMEVSSIALHQRRVEALTFAGAIFTNLTQDHLDYHGTMDDYFAAKARWFNGMLDVKAAAVLNIDDARVATLTSSSRGRVITISAKGTKASLFASRVTTTADGTVIDVDGEWGTFVLKTPLVGSYNVSNLLGACAVHLATGTSLQSVLDGAAALKLVPGRLEAVPHPKGARVLVDYAHTPDALARALDAVRPYVGDGGRLFCVFGCGGDRDAGKRPRMGEAAAQRADVIVVTNDNPRSEEPQSIASAIVGGITGMASLDGSLAGQGVHVELDRALAIRLAVRAAGRGDVVVIAGKGHEKEQIFKDHKIPFDDRKEAAGAFEEGERR